MRRLILACLIAFPLLLAAGLFAWDSDASVSVQDAFWYARAAETEPRASIHPHHPLFHALVLGVAAIAKALGVEHPGHAAVRIVGGAGAALALFVIARMAGPRRWWVGALAAFLLLVMRGFLVEFAVGETVVPALGATLWCLDEVTRRPPRLARAGIALVLAMLLRQDTVLAVPGLVAGAWLCMPPPGRARRIAAWLSTSALAVLAGYVLAWKASGTAEDFVGYLLRFGRHGSWSVTQGWDSAVRLLESIAVVVAGRQWHVLDPNAWLGPLVCLALIAIAWGLRGDGPIRGFLVAVALILVVRTCFFFWFEPQNSEWQVTALAMLCAVIARSAAGAPVRSRAVRVISAAALAVALVAVALAHVRPTLELRDSSFARLVRDTTRDIPRPCRFLAHGSTAPVACIAAGLDVDLLRGDHVRAFGLLLRDLTSRPRRTAVITDRFVIDGMPHSAAHPSEYQVDLDRLGDYPRVRVLRHLGLVFGIVFDPG